MNFVGSVQAEDENPAARLGHGARGGAEEMSSCHFDFDRIARIEGSGRACGLLVGRRELEQPVQALRDWGRDGVSVISMA